MPSTSPTQRGGSRNKAFSRHYHRVTHAPVPIASNNRRDLEIKRRGKRSHRIKWFAISLTLFSFALGFLLFLTWQK